MTCVSGLLCCLWIALDDMDVLHVISAYYYTVYLQRFQMWYSHVVFHVLTDDWLVDELFKPNTVIPHCQRIRQTGTVKAHKKQREYYHNTGVTSCIGSKAQRLNSSLHCIFDQTSNVVAWRNLYYPQRNKYEDTDQTNIAKEALLPVTEGKYPERIVFPQYIVFWSWFKQSNTGF